MCSLVRWLAGSVVVLMLLWVPGAHASGTISQPTANEPYVYDGSSGNDVLTISARVVSSWAEPATR